MTLYTMNLACEGDRGGGMSAEAILQKARQVHGRFSSRVLLACRKRWSSAQFDVFWIDEFPTLESYREYEAEAGRHPGQPICTITRYGGLATEDYEDMRWDLSEPRETSKVYKLWLARGRETYYGLGADGRQHILDTRNQCLQYTGGRQMLVCRTWTSEQWNLFGIEEFPDLESLVRYQLELQKLNWHRFVDGLVHFGQPMPEYTHIDWRLRAP